ncbi:CPBP family intramembrane metalloprotease [Actinospica durhamensis]|uniref:CPBP family intramembrane metalloprotease n=2 Tax=Actinospica durhamensis TaxID=1508375 RepID=A0A941IPS2_9ACTN|nr:type II CAAX endopeptidase family protein [Actinospica durhamensis]MBR7832228.1 CPBP family intramembrane metalloprotease [Actinospica durhamensis]
MSSTQQQSATLQSARDADRIGSNGDSGSRAPRWAGSAWVRLPVLFVLMLAVDAIASGINSAADGTPLTALIAGVATGGLALVAYVRLVRYLEGRRTLELAPERARRELGRGIGFGVGLFAVTIALVALSGSYHVHGWGSFGGALTSLGLMSSAAVTEELAFRGALFRILEEKAGTWGALVASGLVFGGLHLINPNATVWGALAIAIEAGLMFGAIYAATRSLWLAIGLHLGWNVAEEGIFGTAVSGSDSHTGGLLHASVSGPQILSGGSFGPEASIFAIAVCAVPTVLFLLLAKRRNRIHTRAALAAAAR